MPTNVLGRTTNVRSLPDKGTPAAKRVRKIQELPPEEPAGLPKDVEATLIAALDKAINLPAHRSKAEALSLDPSPTKGEAYRRFLKDNEQATKKLMNW